MTATALRAVEPRDDVVEPITIALAPAREDRDWRAIAVAVRGLRGASTVAQLLGLVPAELCRCGFTRAWVSRVDGTNYLPVAFHAANDRVPEPSRRLDRVEPGSLVHGTHEAEVVRRRRALLVPDAGDTGPAQLADPLTAELFAPRSYVVAPLVVDTRVVALLHADRPRSTLPLDDYDRDVVDVFVEAVGQALQRVILGERLEKLRVDVRALTNSVGDLVDDRCDEPIGLARPGADSPGPARPPAAPAANGCRLASLLTSRELEVLRLMATGETNAGIAKELVISQGTVKSHVKNVLRKLHATNRAQAVSRYFRLVRADGAH